MSALVRTLAIAMISLTGLVAALTHDTDLAGAQASGSVELVAQSAWVDDGGIFDLQVRVAGADPDSTVGVRIYPPWLERDDFLRLSLPDEIQPVLELEPIVLGEVQAASNEVLPIEVFVAGPNTAIDEPDPDDPAPLPILITEGGSAVHPVEISLYTPDGQLADRFVTSLIELPRAERNAPLRVSIVLEAHLPAAIAPDGSTNLDPDAVRDLLTLTEAIDLHPMANLAISISPDALVALEREGSEETERIIEHLSTLRPEQLLPNPYSEVQEQAWVDSELTSELLELYRIGSTETQRVLGTEPTTSVMILDRTVDDSGLSAIAELGVQGVIVRPAQLSPLDRERFPQALTTRFTIETTQGTSMPALVADGGLANHFTNPGGASYNANQLLADLTMLSLQNSDVRQAVVVNPPVTWEPDATFLNVLLSGLERIPAIASASPIDALTDTAFTPENGIGTLSAPLQRELKPQRSAESLRSFRTDYNQARSAIDSWATVIAADQPSLSRLSELLQSSTDYRLTDTQRNEYIDEIYTLINSQKDASITTPESETITLTGRISDVPIIVENNLGFDATVLLLLDSEKLSFPSGREIAVTLAPGPNRIEIPIEARASGDSPIRVQVFSPDRSVLLGSSEVLVRTFAFSGVGVVIGIVAIAVLLLWWLRHRRSTRDTIAASETPSPEDPSPAEEPLGV